MTRTAKSSSSASRNAKSEGRTTAKFVTVFIDKDGKLLNSVRSDVKGTSDGMLYGKIREHLASQGHSIPAKLPASKADGFIVKLGELTMITRLLSSWKQCPNCGATQDNPTTDCPMCEESLTWSKQETDDFKETCK